MIDMNKQYKTRGGKDVRIYEIYDSEIHGTYKEPLGKWVITTWYLSGLNTEYTYLDLIEVKPRIRCSYWFNVYPTETSWGYATKELADKGALDRIACVEIKIDVEQGESL